MHTITLNNFECDILLAAWHRTGDVDAGEALELVLDKVDVARDALATAPVDGSGAVNVHDYDDERPDHPAGRDIPSDTPRVARCAACGHSAAHYPHCRYYGGYSDHWGDGR